MRTCGTGRAAAVILAANEAGAASAGVGLTHPPSVGCCRIDWGVKAPLRGAFAFCVRDRLRDRVGFALALLVASRSCGNVPARSGKALDFPLLTYTPTPSVPLVARGRAPGITLGGKGSSVLRGEGSYPLSGGGRAAGPFRVDSPKPLLFRRSMRLRFCNRGRWCVRAGESGRATRVPPR